MQKSTVKKLGNMVCYLFAKAKETTLEITAKLNSKQGRDELVAKTKEMAIIARDRTIVLWGSGLKGRVAICAAALVILWIITPSCGDSGKSKGAATKGGIAKLKMKKLRNTDALFFEGKFPQGTSGIVFEDAYNGGGPYKSVVPNVIVLPDNISNEHLCGIFNPEMKDLRKKGTSYINNPDDVYYCVVDHVAPGHVIVKPSSISMHGLFYGYIETSDEYIEGARLNLGFYTFLGTTKTVPLVNGSSQTMYAFRKLDDTIASELFKAIEYNANAVEAAQSENVRRNGECLERKEEIDKKFDENIESGTDEIFRKAIASYDSKEWESHIHVAKPLKGKVKISDGAKWQWLNNGEPQEISFADFKKKLEKEGGSSYMESNDSYYTILKNNHGDPTIAASSARDYVLECASKTLKSRRYILKIEGSDNFICYRVEFYSNGSGSIKPTMSEWDLTFQLYSSLSPFGKEEPSVHFYIVDSQKDEDIKSTYKRFGNSQKTVDAIIDLFEKKYGK